MKAELSYWHKAKLKARYVLELKIHRVGISSRYPHGLKYGLILLDEKTGRKVLMDNHHPKGPHIHVDSEEMPYGFTDETRLLEDFRGLALKHLGVKL